MKIIRSWLIAPANRPNYLAKFPQLGADCSVMDLEDGTPEPMKAPTRAQLPQIVDQLRGQAMQRDLHLRVNHPRSAHHVLDIQAAGLSGVDGISIPKLASVAELKAAVALLEPHEQRLGRRIDIVGGIESALGVLNVSEIAFADERLVALYFGAEDFATDLLGARRTHSNLEVLYARSRVVCLNPRQVELANQFFSPSPEEVDFSRRLLEAARQAEVQGIGTIDFEGRMIDGPLIKRCEHILAMANQHSQ